jgi:hypothetical protein
MDIPIVSILWILVIVIVVGYIANVFLTTPVYKDSEGFFGGVARGAGHPDCLRTLQGSAEIMDKLGSRNVDTEEGRPDYRELELILSKLACLKKDLMSPSGIVEATRYQPYETSHDREPIAEVTATCLNHTIAPRDLDIIFATFRDRGMFLLRRLCTEASLSESESKHLETVFMNSWKDVYDVAKGRCIPSKAEQMGAGRQEQPYTPPALEDARPYDGYYSGWTGQV